MFTNPITGLLGGVSLLLLVGIGVQTYRINSFATETAQAKQSASEARSMADGVARAYAENDTDNMKKLLANKVANDMELEDLRRTNTTLQATLNQKAADYNKVSTRLQGIIDNAPKTDSRNLGPTMLKYFNELRDAQHVWHVDDDKIAGSSN